MFSMSEVTKDVAHKKLIMKRKVERLYFVNYFYLSEYLKVIL